MIKGLVGDKHVTVTGGNTSVPYVNYNNNNPIQGMIRIHGTDLQVFRNLLKKVQKLVTKSELK